MEIFVASLIFVGFSFFILGFNIIFRKGKTFPVTEIGHNKEMRKKGIICAKDEERKIWKKKNKAAGCSDDVCSGCGYDCIK